MPRIKRREVQGDASTVAIAPSTTKGRAVITVWADYPTATTSTLTLEAMKDLRDKLDAAIEEMERG